MKTNIFSLFQEMEIQLLTCNRPPQNENEIVIPTHLNTSGRNKLKVGDSITLNIGQRVDVNGEILDQSIQFIDSKQEKIINTTSKNYKVVGIAERPSFNIEDYSH